MLLLFTYGLSLKCRYCSTMVFGHHSLPPCTHIHVSMLTHPSLCVILKNLLSAVFFLLMELIMLLNLVYIQRRIQRFFRQSRQVKTLYQIVLLHRTIGGFAKSTETNTKWCFIFHYYWYSIQFFVVIILTWNKPEDLLNLVLNNNIRIFYFTKLYCKIFNVRIKVILLIAYSF